MSPDRWRMPGRGVRLRTSLVATATVAVALLVGGVLLVLIVRSSLTDGIEQAARLRAVDIQTLIESGNTPRSIAIDDEEDAVVQVINHQGRVIAASTNIDGQPALVTAPIRRGSLLLSVPVDDHPFLIVTQQAAGAEGPLTIISGRSTEAVQQTVGILVGPLAIGLPLLALLVGIATYYLTGTTLRPVERIRAHVAELQSTDLTSLVPVPDSEDEIARLAATMNDMLGRLDTAQRQQQQFVADASHELRSPIATIRQLAEVALIHPDRLDVDLLRDIHAEDLRLQQLVDDLLLLARSDETGRDGRRQSTIDLDDLALAEAARVRATTTLDVDTTGIGPARTTGSADQIGRAVRNLVDNAIRHAGGDIALSTSADGDRAHFCVADDGDGVPDGERDRIFGRFVRLDNARARDAGGAGLGLAIVRQIAVSHGGTVTVRDGIRGGARFDLSLPNVEWHSPLG